MYSLLIFQNKKSLHILVVVLDLLIKGIGMGVVGR